MYPELISIGIITLSDRASRGEYEDLSGPEISMLCSDYFSNLNIRVEIEVELIPDQPDQLIALINRFVEKPKDLIFTTGGTGIGPRDFTPDVVKPMLTKEIPGVMEMIRVKYGMSKPNALTSRGVSGVIRSSLIYTLPGSVRAVREYCAEILPTIVHSLRMLHGIDDHT